MLRELKELRNFVLKFLQDGKLIFSTPLLRMDKSSSNENSKELINCLKKAKCGKGNWMLMISIQMGMAYKWILAKNLILGAHEIWCEKDSLIKVSKLKYGKSKFTPVSTEAKVEDSSNAFLTELKPEPY